LNKTNITCETFKPLKNKVFVTNLDHGAKKTASGIILIDDNNRDTGIRDRWAQVYAIGEGVDDLVVGDWVLLKHGRWTNGIDLSVDGTEVKVWAIDYPDAVMLVSEEDPRTTSNVTF
jgi:co-chaperonin GroES (HSP10)